MKCVSSVPGYITRKKKNKKKPEETSSTLSHSPHNTEHRGRAAVVYSRKPCNIRYVKLSEIDALARIHVHISKLRTSYTCRRITVGFSPFDRELYRHTRGGGESRSSSI